MFTSPPASLPARFALTLAAALLIAACEPAPAPGSAGETRGTLALGLLPDENPVRQAARYAPLTHAIKSRTGLDVELITPASYEELVDRFVDGDLDLAYFGGYTFLLAHERAGAVPLVMRDIDARFVSFVIVHADSPARDVSDLRGARFSFGSKNSTSGHLMPRYYLARQGIVPESFFSSVSYSGAHDLTVRQVADGTVEAGAANGQIVRSMLEGSEGGAPAVRIIWQSPPYVDYVWAAQPSMSEQARQAITEVFLSFSTGVENERSFLDAIGARFFLPAADTDFDELRTAVHAVDQGVAPEHAP